MNHHGSIWAQFAPLAVLILVILLRLRRMNRQRRFNPGRVWIVPAAYVLLVAAMLAVRPPVPLGWGLLALGLALGAALGWQRGRWTHLDVAPGGKSLLARQSPAAMLLIVALLVLRVGARELFLAVDPSRILLATDALLGFALGFLALQRIEMALRARRLLAQAER